jgi:tetratricopeptide (TPR) repeat protein
VIELLLDAESQLALGLLDQAERTYRTVLEADPRNGIAAVGLSRVALERGDDDAAHALAEAALAIDPENATARRMIDRLDEVARYRDTAVAARSDDDSQAMIRAPGIPGVEREDPWGPRAPGGADSSRPEHAENRAGNVANARGADESRPGADESRPGADESRPGAPLAPLPAAPTGAEQETSTHGQQPAASAGPPGIPSAGPREPAPARPGFLRRIIRRP